MLELVEIAGYVVGLYGTLAAKRKMVGEIGKRGNTEASDLGRVRGS